MSKRELSKLIGVADVEGSRLKRRRDATLPSPTSEVDMTISGSTDGMLWSNGNSSNVGDWSVKEQGLHLLQTVKEAKAKDGRLLALAFLTKPPRKVYPDYYQIIQKPIALDDIKKRLDTNAFSSLQAIRTDFELLFHNALEYNMKDSIIWKDAKDLLKLVQKTYENLTPQTEVGDVSDDDDEKKGKSKGSNLNRMIKSRLQKLIEKTDKDGRIMSTEFMQLPNKKQWAIYYKQIKKPQCLENIFKKIRRKEYHSSTTFASDVELVFSNAMAFNQDHTVIWEDALALRDYFKQLMSDLPPPYSLPEYSNNKSITNKIRIKPPIAPSATQPDPTTSKSEPSSSTLLLRVPAANAAIAKPSQSTTAQMQGKAKPTPVSTTPGASVVASSAITINAPTKAASQPQPPAQQTITSATQIIKSTSTTPQPTAATQQATFAYSNYYQSPIVAPAPSTTFAAPTVKTTPITSTLLAPTPTPINSSHQIKFAKVRIQPQGRLFWLDHREGVKTWALRLAPGETGLLVGDLVFAGDERAEESSDDEEDESKQEEEEDMEVDGSSSSLKNGRIRKGKSVVRRSQRAVATTRTTRSAVAKNKLQEEKEPEKVEEVLLKLNGIVVKEEEDMPRQWNVSLPAGSNVLEIGEKGGLMWKVHVER